VFVYWIRREQHSDIWTQGYVGVTSNTVVRLSGHKRTENRSRVKSALLKHKDAKLEIVFEGNRDECLSAEMLFRPRKEIGWNLDPGGNMPGRRRRGIPSPDNPACRLEVRKKIGDSRRGKHYPKLSAAKKGQGLGKKRPEHSKFMSDWNRTRNNTGCKNHHWWNNGIVSTLSKECPAGYKRGRLVPWNHEINRSIPHKKNRCA
jgi:hypothetical protein